MKSKFTIGCFGIIFDQSKKVLLCHRRDYDLWNLPGGALEEGESPKECVIREIEEETGSKVNVNKLVGVYSKTNKNDLVLSFLCSIASGKITTTDEADEIKYFPVDSLPKNTVPKQVERIQDAIKFKGKVIFKTQTGKSSIELLKEGKL
jgi:8-oxo-dGTP diphosphatase